MLHPPHTRYDRLFIYYLDRLGLPPVDHPDYIGLWVEDEHSILFFHSAQDRLVASLCRQSDAQLLYQADLAYRDWEAGMTIGPFSSETLSVRPVWEPANSDGMKKNEIILDPSVIFGSGFHPTTRLCLEQIEQILLKSWTRIRTVADLGTGTGLLAVAAAKLGAEKVTAIDNNPLACKVARNNVVLNGCADKVTVQRRDLSIGLPREESYDLVVANLYKALLERLFSDSAFWKAGLYIISGIIPAMEGDLLAALPPKGVRLLLRKKSEIWRLWLLKAEDSVGQRR